MLLYDYFADRNDLLTQALALIAERLLKLLHSALPRYFCLAFEIRAIAGQLSDGFLLWITARLKVAKEADRAATATLLFATVEGICRTQGE